MNLKAFWRATSKPKRHFIRSDKENASANDDMPRRLQTLRNPTFNAKGAFGGSSRTHDQRELEILNAAYEYLAMNLGSNLRSLRSLGMIRDNLVFDVLDDSDFNAFASTKEGNDVIVVNAGLVLCLFLIYGRIAQLPTAFTWLGAVKADSGPIPSFECLPTSINHLYSRQLELLGPGPHRLDEVMERLSSIRLLPEDAKRRQLAIHLWRWSLLFVIYHELGHLAFGHVDHFMARHRGTLFAELARSDPERIA